MRYMTKIRKKLIIHGKINSICLKTLVGEIIVTNVTVEVENVVEEEIREVLFA